MIDKIDGCSLPPNNHGCDSWTGKIQIEFVRNRVSGGVSCEVTGCDFEGVDPDIAQGCEADGHSRTSIVMEVEAQWIPVGREQLDCCPPKIDSACWAAVRVGILEGHRYLCKGLIELNKTFGREEGHWGGIGFNAGHFRNLGVVNKSFLQLELVARAVGQMDSNGVRPIISAVGRQWLH